MGEVNRGKKIINNMFVLLGNTNVLIAIVIEINQAFNRNRAGYTTKSREIGMEVWVLSPPTDRRPKK